MTAEKVAFQGLPGSFTYLAAVRYFGGSRELEGQKNFREIFSKVASSGATRGIAPLENSLAGSVHDVYDLLWNFELFITGETFLRINHHLLAVPQTSGQTSAGERIAKIKKVFSHPKALEQCVGFFESNPGIEKAFFSDTAGAARHVAESGSPELAAIGSRECAELYKLDILKENLEDNPNNITRFIVISQQPESRDNSNKCSLIFTLPHVPSSLFRALETVSIGEINVVKIESRPIHGKPFEYLFYIDFEFENRNLAAVDAALEKLRERTLILRNLGFYKAADRVAEAGS